MLTTGSDEKQWFEEIDNTQLINKIKTELTAIDLKYSKMFSCEKLDKDIKARYIQETINLINTYGDLSFEDKTSLFDFCSHSKVSNYRLLKCCAKKQTEACRFFRGLSAKETTYRDVLSYDPLTLKMNRVDINYSTYDSTT